MVPVSCKEINNHNHESGSDTTFNVKKSVQTVTLINRFQQGYDARPAGMTF